MIDGVEEALTRKETGNGRTNEICRETTLQRRYKGAKGYYKWNETRRSSLSHVLGRTDCRGRSTASMGATALENHRLKPDSCWRFDVTIFSCSSNSMQSLLEPRLLLLLHSFKCRSRRYKGSMSVWRNAMTDMMICGRRMWRKSRKQQCVKHFYLYSCLAARSGCFRSEPFLTHSTPGRKSDPMNRRTFFYSASFIYGHHLTPTLPFPFYSGPRSEYYISSIFHEVITNLLSCTTVSAGNLKRILPTNDNTAWMFCSMSRTLCKSIVCN